MGRSSNIRPKARPATAQITRAVGLLFVLGLTGCAGFSQQLRATTSGIKIEYQVPRETLPIPKSAVRVMVKDERLDREFLGPGVRTTFGARLLGVFAFGLISFAVPGEPTFQETDLVGIFQKAFEERFRANGVPVASGSAGDNFYQQHAVEGVGSSDQVALEVLVRHLRLDFNFGKWIGEVGYVLRMKKGQKLLCEDSISERVTRMNVWGFGSGERVISDAFAKAVNRANLSACLSRLEE